MDPSEDTDLNAIPNADNGRKLKIIFAILAAIIVGELLYFTVFAGGKKFTPPTFTSLFFLEKKFTKDPIIIPSIQHKSIISSTQTPVYPVENKKQILKEEKVELSDLTKLNKDYSDFNKYTIITREDILSGKLAEAEKQYILTSSNKIGNFFFYKLAVEKGWLKMVGLEIENKDGSIGFLHYCLGLFNKNEVISLKNIKFSFTTSLEDEYFNRLGIPRSFFSSDKDYYQIGGKIGDLIRAWNKEGIVSSDLEKYIILGD